MLNAIPHAVLQLSNDDIPITRNTSVDTELYRTAKRLLLKHLSSQVTGTVFINQIQGGFSLEIVHSSGIKFYYSEHRLSEKILYGTTISELSDDILHAYKSHLKKLFFKPKY